MANRPDELYIFVTSARPDPYVNIIAHAVRSFHVKKIHFVGIIKHDYKNEQGEMTARAVSAATFAMLESLASGKYPQKDQDEPIEAEQAGIYKDCIARLDAVQVSSLEIHWNDLAGKLIDFAKNDAAVFDVTALRNSLLVDVVALLLSQGSSQLWTFDAIRRFTFDSRDLIHAMNENVDYMYRCLSDSKHVETAIKRMLARSLTFRSLLVITIVLLVPIGTVHLLFPQSWVQSIIISVTSTVGIATWFLVMKRG